MTGPTVSPDQRNALYSALGILVVNFAALEESLHDAIVLALDGKAEMPSVNLLTAGLSFRTLVEKLGATCRSSKGLRVSLAALDTFLAHLNKLNEQRNAMIHSAWAIRDPDDAPLRFKRSSKGKEGFTFHAALVPIEDIRSLSIDLSEAEKKLWEVVS